MYTNKIWMIWLIVYPQKWKYPCRLFGHPWHFLGTRFSSSNTCWRLVHPNPNQEELALDSSNQVRAELDGSYIDVPWKGCIARGEIRSWESTKKAPLFWMSKDKKLYKRSFSRPYLLCVHLDASESLLEELHEGVCGSHTWGRSLSHRAITQGYWWLGMQKEA